MKKGLPLAIVIAGLGAGCALVLGIEDKPVVIPDGGGVDAADATPPPDPCVHKFPPTAPATDDDPVLRATFVVAARSFDLAEANDAGPIGLDLDDTCTCSTGPGARHDGGPSCTSKTGAPTCDREGGVDNAFGGLAFITAVTSDPKSNDRSIQCGRTALLLVIQGYNGRANDTSITLGPVLSPGLTTPHETNGGEPPSDCNPDGGGLPVVYTPRWDGTDQWSSDTNFVGPPGTAQPLALLKGYVHDWVLVARAAKGQVVKVPFGPIVVAGSQMTVVARLEPLDAAGNPLPPDSATRAASVRVREGQIAVRASAKSALAGISSVNIDKLGFLCPGNPLYENVKQSLCEALDVATDPELDFSGSACDAISAAVGFIGDPAQMRPPDDPIGTDAGPCANIAASCD